MDGRTSVEDRFAEIVEFARTCDKRDGNGLLNTGNVRQWIDELSDELTREMKLRFPQE